MTTPLQPFVDQALATAINYAMTGRPDKAIGLVAQAAKVGPSPVADQIMRWLATGDNRGLPAFIGEWWTGGPLAGKSVEVFCDQGMGDVINLLRYLKVMKDRWACRVVLNCYAFHAELAPLLAGLPYVDEFTPAHARCDYFTNLMSVPALLGGLAFDVYYPAHWTALLATPVPPQPPLAAAPLVLDGGFRVGLAWRSNLSNPIGAKKSLPVEAFAPLEDGVTTLYSLLPDEDKYNMMVNLPLKHLGDTARAVAGVDAVVTVDTAVLHLAGAMGKPTLALLPAEADPRWGGGPGTVWYPSVELFRQPPDGDWDATVARVKERLVAMRHLV